MKWNDFAQGTGLGLPISFGWKNHWAELVRGRIEAGTPESEYQEREFHSYLDSQSKQIKVITHERGNATVTVKMGLNWHEDIDKELLLWNRLSAD